MKENFDDINDLLVKYLLGESTPEENRTIEAWIAAEDANKKHYEEFKLIWDESKQLAADSTIDEEAAWQRFRKRADNTSEQKASDTGRTKSFGWMRIAALFVAMAGVGFFTYTFLNNKEIQTIAVQAQDNVVVDTLPDGSMVTVNKHSVLSYPEKFKGHTRSVNLQGEAFFNVAPDKTKPFTIHVNDILIKVVGTSFNVRNKNGNTEVIVETGVVQVISKDKQQELRAGEKMIVNKQDSVAVKEPVSDKLYNYYRTKEFECDNTPLWKLVAALNDVYGSNIIIEREELKSLPLSTTFNNESLDRILYLVGKTLGITVEQAGDKIILK